MKYDIQKRIDYILNTAKPLSLRAVELFTLLIALHAGKSLARVTGHKIPEGESNLTISVPKQVLRHARLLAAMKILDQIEAEWKTDNPGKQARLSAMIKIPDYQAICNDLILRNGGWQKIRFVPGVRHFEDDMQTLIRQAQDVARIIEFSIKFQPNSNRPKQPGGITMSIDIVTSGAKYFSTQTKKSQLHKAWSQRKSAAPFYYLLYVQKYPYFLDMIAGKRFALKWLKRAEDRGALLDFLVAYNAVAERLQRRKYHYSQLRLPTDAPAPQIDFGSIRSAEKYANEILIAISTYRS